MKADFSMQPMQQPARYVPRNSSAVSIHSAGTPLTKRSQLTRNATAAPMRRGHSQPQRRSGLRAQVAQPTTRPINRAATSHQMYWEIR